MSVNLTTYYYRAASDALWSTGPPRLAVGASYSTRDRTIRSRCANTGLAAYGVVEISVAAGIGALQTIQPARGDEPARDFSRYSNVERVIPSDRAAADKLPWA